MRLLFPLLAILGIFSGVAVAAADLDKEAGATFAKFAASLVLEQKPDAIVLGTLDKIPNTYVPLTFRAELRSPEFKIYRTNLLKLRNNLTPAEKLNGYLADVEWHGYAVSTASAYKVLETRQTDPTHKYSYKWGLLADDRWHPFGREQGGLFALFSPWVVMKTAKGWTVEPLSGENNYGDSHGSYTLSGRQLAAQGFLCAEAPKPSAPDVVPDTKRLTELFEELVQNRTAETLILKRSRREEKISMKSLDEDPFERVDTVLEFHKPKLSIVAIPLTEAEKINGIEGKALVKLTADTWRTVSITPKPEKLTQFDDGRWVNGMNAMNVECKAYFQKGEWKLYSSFVKR